MGCFYQLLVCSCGCGKTNKCAKKCTQTFWKTVLINQVHAHSWPMASCGPSPGLKVCYYVGLLQIWSHVVYADKSLKIFNDYYAVMDC